ncbi:MAG: Maf family protein, partial [Anaerolineae bacterium]|nr:Maf family protein [Anaerolineae bacterium]
MTPQIPTPFILASGSPRRREMITSLGIHFTIIKPDIDESQHPSETPLAYVQRLASAKADAVAERLSSPATILAADTIVILSADTIG